MTTGYDNVGNPLTLIGADTYVAGTSYHQWGPVYQRTLGASDKRVRVTTSLEEATGRLTTAATDTENPTAPGTWVNQLTENYTYDPAGSVRSIQETSGTTTVSNQCFDYDGLGQLTEAWTTTAAACQGTPTQTVVAGPEAYWTSYTYTTLGLRQTETRRATAGDLIRTYTYPTGTGVTRPHSLTSVTMTGTSTETDTFGYDATGNTTTRAIAGRPGQTLTWDNEGHLATITDTSGTTSYVYDADGNRLIAREPTGTTAYLGDHELRKASSGNITCTRFYASGAVRTTGGGLTWQTADHHGTTQLTVTAASLAVARRRLDPFGNPRGAQPTWPTTKGFVNGTTDPTGLTHLGAREYDPTIGRFVSVDPIMDNADPQQLNGYTYADNTPVVMSDPAGTMPVCGGGSGPDTCGHDWIDVILDQPIEKRHTSKETPPPDERVRKNPKTKSNAPGYGTADKFDPDYLKVQGMLHALLMTTLVAVCSKYDRLACGLWKHYAGGSGKDFIVDPRAILQDEFAIGVQKTRDELAREAAAMCSGSIGTTCTVDVNSLWRETEFNKDQSLHFGIGHMRYRIRGTFTVVVGEGGNSVSGSYDLDVYKSWNFDYGKPDGASPIEGQDLDAYANMQRFEVGREFAMKGTAGGFAFNTTVPRG